MGRPTRRHPHFPSGRGEGNRYDEDRGGAIHIQLPGRVMISVESGADRALLRCVLASLRK